MKRIIVVALEEELAGYERQPDEQVVICGVGKVNAAIATVAAVVAYSPKEVINIGTCGAHESVAVGTIFNPINFQDGTHGPYSSFTEHYQVIGKPRLGDLVCVSHDAFTDKMARFHIVDMEAYAIAKVCKGFDVPFRCYKIASDSGKFTDWKSAISRVMPTLWDFFRKEP